jgi:hypothetical protein
VRIVINRDIKIQINGKQNIYQSSSEEELELSSSSSVLFILALICAPVTF